MPDALSPFKYASRMMNGPRARVVAEDGATERSGKCLLARHRCNVSAQLQTSLRVRRPSGFFAHPSCSAWHANNVQRFSTSEANACLLNVSFFAKYDEVGHRFYSLSLLRGPLTTESGVVRRMSVPPKNSAFVSRRLPELRAITGFCEHMYHKSQPLSLP